MNTIHNATSPHKRAVSIAVAVLMTILILLSVASTNALAAPKGIFARFAQCPTNVAGVALCQYVEITSGEMTIGSLRIPIDKTIILQDGAVHTGGESLNEYFLLPAVNGESVSSTKLDVPGGLRSIINCDGIKSRDLFRGLRRGVCRASSRGRESEVGVRIEGVASPSNPAILELAAVAFEEGTGLTFPARIHLENPLLGEACYLGSASNPIELNLTDGTTSPPPPNQPISGKAGTASEEKEAGQSLTVTAGSTFVDNSFSVPPVEGCGGHLSSVIDPLIDRTLGLASPAGRNTVILSGTDRIAEVEAVIASEAFPVKENPPPHHHRWWPAQLNTLDRR